MERRSYKTAGCFVRNCPIARAAGYGHWQSLPAGFLGKEPVRKKPKKKNRGVCRQRQCRLELHLVLTRQRMDFCRCRLRTLIPRREGGCNEKIIYIKNIVKGSGSEVSPSSGPLRRKCSILGMCSSQCLWWETNSLRKWLFFILVRSLPLPSLIDLWENFFS